jgi:hypothetical protein
MIFLIAIAGVGVIGWFGPALALRVGSGRLAAVAGVLAAWLIGFAYVYGAAYLTTSLFGGDLRDEVERSINAWKLILLIAPASALHHLRAKAADEGDR